MSRSAGVSMNPRTCPSGSKTVQTGLGPSGWVTWCSFHEGGRVLGASGFRAAVAGRWAIGDPLPRSLPPRSSETRWMTTSCPDPGWPCTRASEHSAPMGRAYLPISSLTPNRFHMTLQDAVDSLYRIAVVEGKAALPNGWTVWPGSVSRSWPAAVFATPSQRPGCPAEGGRSPGMSPGEWTTSLAWRFP